MPIRGSAAASACAQGLRAAVLFGIAACLAMLVPTVAKAEQLGDVQITLHTHTYYKQADVTRIVYKVKSVHGPGPVYWILEVGDCLTPEDIVDDASTEYEWVSEPFRGLKYYPLKSSPTNLNEKVDLYLEGQWDVTEGRVLAAFSDGHRGVTTVEGRLDVPLCHGNSISLEILSGESVTFPDILGAGTYDSSQVTRLRVESSTSGWTLQRSLAFSAPEGASAETLAQVFDLAWGPYSPGAGQTDVSVSYTLTIQEQDFVGLPEGAYTIGVTFTVALD